MMLVTVSDFASTRYYLVNDGAPLLPRQARE
jgi:hypothetical protein